MQYVVMVRTRCVPAEDTIGERKRRSERARDREEGRDEGERIERNIVRTETHVDTIDFTLPADLPRLFSQTPVGIERAETSRPRLTTPGRKM
eukprot:1375407-Amorphochlora_amoeboformis.AAC.2